MVGQLLYRKGDSKEYIYIDTGSTSSFRYVASPWKRQVQLSIVFFFVMSRVEELRGSVAPFSSLDSSIHLEAADALASSTGDDDSCFYVNAL